MIRSICHTLLAASICLPLAVAQEGDKKDKQGVRQIDPIPADQIPPSPYLSLKDALKTFQLPEGYVIEPVASGTHTHMPIALSFDANGRAWTVEMRSYMPNLDGNDEDTPNGRIRVLEDTNGDGKIDQSTTFLDGLILPRAVAVTRDGCLYTSGDALYFVKRQGLKPIGKPTLVDKDYAIGGNPEHKANGLIYGHDNWYYSAKSGYRYRRINGKWTKQPVRPRGQWGISKDNAGKLFYNNNSTLLVGDQFPPNFFRGHPTYIPKTKTSPTLSSNKVHPIRITPGVNRAYQKNVLNSEGKLTNTTAACGVHIYRGDNFPANMQGTAFVCEPVGDLVKAITITRNATHKPSGKHTFGNKEFLASTDEWFSPVNVYTAPDGTLWIIDMYHGLLQHRTYMTTYLRKQYLSRKLHQPKPSNGRIYRIRYTGKKLTHTPQLETLSPTRLVSYLAHPNGTIRDTAQRLLTESKPNKKTIAHLEKLAEDGHVHGSIHALWTLDALNALQPHVLRSAMSRGHENIINAGLEIATTRRFKDDSFTQAILTLKDTLGTLHHRIRALAACGAPTEALNLTLKHKNTPYTREAFLSGLGKDTTAFRKQHGKITDKPLDLLLYRATKPPKTAQPGQHLQGKALASFNRGKTLYTTRAACFGCHGGKGEGIDNLGPPLAQSEWVTGDPARLAKILLHGMTGPVTVNGKKYTPAAAMPGIKDNPTLTNQDIADVITYTRNAWGNKAKPVQPQLIQKTRQSTQSRTLPYTEKELK